MKFTETSKEKLLEYWQGVERQTGLNINYKERVTGMGLNINYKERVTGIARRPDGMSFEVRTTRNAYVTRAVLLTIGRRGTPRQLGVPGEKSSMLVVGGGDSALEAAHSIAEQPGTTVTISYRSPAFTRAKPKNREKVAQLAAAGQLNVLMSSNVREIRRDSVAIDVDGEPVILPNHGVIVCAGGILPTGFLKEVGIEVETKYGTA
jgi:thioredoxin reductase